jgi:hypothetical protein
MKIRNLLFAGISGLMTLTLWAQQSAAASRKPGGNVPSLPETMQSIQNELNHVGKLSFVIHIQDKEEGNSTTGYSEEMSNALADPASCTIKFHLSKWMQGKMVEDEDVSVGLKDVLGLSMMTAEQHEKVVFEREKGSPDEKQSMHMKLDPPMFLVVARSDEENEQGFVFGDEKAANRAARAIVRAVKLCGGKSGPF